MSAKRQRGSGEGFIVCTVSEGTSMPTVDAFGVLERDAAPEMCRRISHSKTFDAGDKPTFADLWMHFDGKMLKRGTSVIPFVDLDAPLVDLTPWVFTTCEWTPEFQSVRDRLAVHKLTVVHELLVQRTRKAKSAWLDCREKQKTAARELEEAQEKLKQ